VLLFFVALQSDAEMRFALIPLYLASSFITFRISALSGL